MASSRRSAASNKKFTGMDKKEPKPGNLINFPRDGYQHWAVYVGDGNIVHFVTPEAWAGKGVVLKEKLQDVVKKNKWRVRNILDYKYTPRPADDIVRDACSLVDAETKYHLLKYNSEHFATEMRYGSPESQQEAKRGDLIKISRGCFKHWAVYVGGGNVVHFVPTGLLAIKGIVLKEKLQDVVKKNKWRVSNLLDYKYERRPADDIVNKACSLVDAELLYDLVINNCQHFATGMRYGWFESRQVNTATGITAGAGLFLAAAGIIATGGTGLIAAGAITAAGVSMAVTAGVAAGGAALGRAIVGRQA